MPISHKYKCIFIHIPKSGGTSILNALDIIHGDTSTENRKSLVGWISSEDLKAYGFASPTLQHLTANDIRKIIPEEIFKNYYKFAIIRNPWERMLSQYLFDESLGLPSIAGKPKKKVSFVEYLKDLSVFLRQEQYEFITDVNGNLLVDYVGRLENLEKDFKIICKNIGAPEPYLPFENTTKHTHYSEYYTEETKQIIQKLFKNDIEMFGYHFEKGSWFDKRKDMMLSLFKEIRHKLHKVSKS